MTKSQKNYIDKEKVACREYLDKEENWSALQNASSKAVKGLGLRKKYIPEKLYFKKKKVSVRLSEAKFGLNICCFLWVSCG